MLVYRVENADRDGPYQGSRTTDLSRHYNVDTHPGPWHDGIPNVSYFHRFAFASLEKFLSWFDAEERAGLARDGYHLSIYDVAPCYVVHGRKQVVFEAEHAILFETMDLVSFAATGCEQLMAA